MIRISIFYNEGRTAAGKKYKVPHTTDFGYNCTVQLNNCQKTQIQFDPIAYTYFVEYDPMKAGMKVNANGYLTLQITE